MQPARIGLVGDSALVEHGLASVLAAVPGLVFAGRTTASQLQLGGWDVVLYDLHGRLDVALPHLRHLVATAHGGPAVALFAYQAPPSVLREARGIGVRSFVSKALDPAELTAALARLAGGQELVATSAWQQGTERGWPGHHDGLSEREGQVLALAAEGLTTREMAAALSIGVETVRSHLKRAYARLGLRNRAEATAFVARSAGAGAGIGPEGFAPPPVAPTVDPRGTPNWPELLRTTILDAAALAERRALFAIGPAVARPPAPPASLVASVAEATGDDLVRRVLASPHSGGVLRAPSSLERLRRHQVRYTRSLVAPTPTREHALLMAGVGASLHRLRLSPQWYLASCAHLLRHWVEMACTNAATPDEAVDWVVHVVRRVLFDASLVVDAFERCMRFELAPETARRQPEQTDPDPDPDGDWRARRDDARAIVVARLTPMIEDWDARCVFLDLDGSVAPHLRELGGHIDGVIAGVVDECDATVGAAWPPARHADAGVRDIVAGRVADYWRGLAVATFDRARAAACARSGVVHVRIGLTPRFYLAALGQQLSSLVRSVASRPEARAEIDALLRALVFDAGFTVDGYLEARAEQLVRANHITQQVVSGLASSVLIVDRNDRVESANGDLAALSQQPDGVRGRLALSSALPLDGIDDMVAAARRADHPRMSATYRAWGRQLQVSAVALHDAFGERAGRVAIVLSDLTEALTASARLDAEGRRLTHVLETIDAAAWDLDRETQTVLGMSAGARRVFGVRDTDLLGTTALLERVHEDDRAELAALCRSVGDGERATIEHRTHGSDGIRLVRTSLAGGRSPGGVATVSAVTFDLGAARDIPSVTGPGQADPVAARTAAVSSR